MRILFVYRGYGKCSLNSVIDFQRRSLIQHGVTIENYVLSKGGIINYIWTVFSLVKYLKKHPVDIIHAHYGYSGFLAYIASGTTIPVICSLMGSDALNQNKIIQSLNRIFCKYFWRVTIVKSAEMKKKFPNALLLPNGVDFSNFHEIGKAASQNKTGFNKQRKNILFVAEDPDSRVKNRSLAEKALNLAGNAEMELHIISGKKFEDLPYYYSAADVLLLTSLSEGSPNVIKEAMACNCPVVATNVGDIAEILGETEGCFVSTFEPRDVADKLKKAIHFGKRTDGRNRIRHLDNKIIAKKIINLYHEVLAK